MRWPGLVMALFAPVAAMAEPTACEEGAKLRYPVSEVLLAEARSLHMAHWREPDPTPDGAGYRRVVLAALEGLGPVETDVRLLALLDVAGGPLGFRMQAVTSGASSTVLDLFEEVLDRRGLSGQAEALRAAKTVYPRWEGAPEDRRAQWMGADGMVSDPALLERLEALSRDFEAARPRVMDTAVALLAEDPALAARLEAERRAADDGARIGYLIRQIFDCLDLDWWTPREADRALGALGPAQREIVVLQTFLDEGRNGGMHQVFWNSSGTLAPELARILDRHGLADHAAAIRTGMALFGWRYPRDTDRRRDRMDRWPDASNHALDELDHLAWDEGGAVETVMAKIAREAGILPE